MSKLPAIHFYTGDWTKDAELSMCSLSTRGFWIEMLVAMHERGRSGQITGTAQQLARVGRCTAAEAEDAIRELRETRAANVSERSGVYTLINRRMKAEFEAREAGKERVRKHRKNGTVTNGNADVTNAEKSGNIEDNGRNTEVKRKGNGNVTPYSSYSTSNTVTTNTNQNLNNGGGGNRGNPPPPPPPDSQKSKTEQRLDELQEQYPHLDVRKIREKYLENCRKHDTLPKWQIFEANWLATEFEPMETVDQVPEEISGEEQIKQVLAKKYGGKK